MPNLQLEMFILLLAAMGLLIRVVVSSWQQPHPTEADEPLPAPDAVFVKNEQASTSQDSGELILTLPRQHEGLALNPVASRCWELMNGRASLCEISSVIAAEYQVTHDTALDEIRRFTKRLRDGYYALEAREWELSHVHFSDLFAGARDEGIAEIRRGDTMIIHLAAGAQGEGASVDWDRLRVRYLPFIARSARIEAARSAFAKHVERETPLREAFLEFNQGWQHSAAGRLAEAARAFQESSRHAPAWANPHYQLGYVYLRARRYEEAVSEFRRTEELSPGYFMVREYLHLARRLAEGRLSIEAFHLFERATTAEPVDPDAVITLCRKALALSPEFPSARLVLGRAYARKRDYEQALAELRGAIDADPDRSTLCNALYARGSIFMARGMAEQAVREFEKVIELDGSPIATRSAMAHLATSEAVH